MWPDKCTPDGFQLCKKSFDIWILQDPVAPDLIPQPSWYKQENKVNMKIVENLEKYPSIQLYLHPSLNLYIYL